MVVALLDTVGTRYLYDPLQVSESEVAAAALVLALKMKNIEVGWWWWFVLYLATLYRAGPPLSSTTVGWTWRR